MKCIRCGSYAINHHEHDRDGSDPDLCDVCYWRKRAEIWFVQIVDLKRNVALMRIELRDALIMAYGAQKNWPESAMKMLRGEE